MEHEQEKQPFVPYSTEEKKEFAKKFTTEQIISYNKGKRAAYAHMSNIGKRNSFFIYDNLNKNKQAESSKPSKQNRKAKQ